MEIGIIIAIVLIIVGIMVFLGIIGLLAALIKLLFPVILRLIARKDVQSLEETAKANEGFAPPQGSEVNEDCYD